MNLGKLETRLRVLERKWIPGEKFSTDEPVMVEPAAEPELAVTDPLLQAAPEPYKPAEPKPCTRTDGGYSRARGRYDGLNR
jgi:hypothetical protein